MAGSEIIGAVEHILVLVVLSGVIWLLADALRKKSTFVIEKDDRGDVRQISELADTVARIQAQLGDKHDADAAKQERPLAPFTGVTPPSPDEEIDILGERGPGGD